MPALLRSLARYADALLQALVRQFIGESVGLASQPTCTVHDAGCESSAALAAPAWRSSALLLQHASGVERFCWQGYSLLLRRAPIRSVGVRGSSSIR